MENVKKHRDNRLDTTERRRKYFVINQLSHCKLFHKVSISNRNEKTQILTNKPVYLGLSILELSKRLMYEF